jgi:hypothetical protein
MMRRCWFRKEKNFRRYYIIKAFQLVRFGCPSGYDKLCTGIRLFNPGDINLLLLVSLSQSARLSPSALRPYTQRSAGNIEEALTKVSSRMTDGINDEPMKYKLFK